MESRRSLPLIVLVGMMAAAIPACHCTGTFVPPDGSTFLSDGGILLPGGGVIGPDGGIIIACTEGSACGAPGDPTCCTGTCGNDGFCVHATTCGFQGDDCSSGVDCCSNRCENGACVRDLCEDVGGSCGDDYDCCTGTCQSGTCEELAGGTCSVLGQACAGDGECCSTNCQGGLCARAASCQANDDICFEDAECCGTLCSRNDGLAGRCIFQTGGGGGGCLQGGNPSDNASNCCSRILSDPGTGALVCQLADGCRLTGESCSDQGTCCGGFPDSYGVDCDTGRCSNGTSCNPPGNICGAPVLPGGGSINASQNCCDGQKDVCKLDGAGIPRCFGGKSGSCPTGFTGEAGCCIADNAPCQFSDQCCGDGLCLPAPGGGLSCQHNSCVAAGATCTPGAGNCCPGTSCASVNGQNVCVTPTEGPGENVCRGNGDSCTTSDDCCSNICTDGTCRAADACQPQTGVCTTSADCCIGLSCINAPGSPSGTCQTGATCNAPGQTCSPTQGCCTGASCVTAQHGECTGAVACTCKVIFE